MADTETKVDIEEVLAAATEAARVAGGIIKESFGRKGDFDVKSKKGVDMVTSVDHVCLLLEEFCPSRVLI